MNNLKQRLFAHAGLGEVFRTGLSVEEASQRLSRLRYVEERLMFLQAARLVDVPERDLKTLLGRFQYQSARRANGLRSRLRELRTPKGLLGKCPDEALAVLLDEVLAAPSSTELVAALRWLRTALCTAYASYLEATNPLADWASADLFQTFVAEERECLALLEAAAAELAGLPEPGPQVEDGENFVERLRPYLEAAGGLDGTGPRGPAVERRLSQAPFQIKHELSRDEAFPRVWDFVAPPQADVGRHFSYMMAIRLSEMNVAEGLAIVLCETANMPWEFYFDISRHLWDEVRHSLMGEAAIEATFGDRSALPMRDYEGVYRMQSPPLEQYATLGLEIEGGNMRYPVGKRGEWEFCRDQAQHPLMTTFQDYDWADEVLHVNLARARLTAWFEGGVKDLAAFAAAGKEHRTQIKRQQSPTALPPVPDRASNNGA